MNPLSTRTVRCAGVSPANPSFGFARVPPTWKYLREDARTSDRSRKYSNAAERHLRLRLHARGFVPTGVIECVNHAPSRAVSADIIGGREYATPSECRCPVAGCADREDTQNRRWRVSEIVHGAGGRGDTRRTRLFEFAPSLLDSLSRHGITLGIVSTKFRRRKSRRVLQRDNLMDASRSSWEARTWRR